MGEAVFGPSGRPLNAETVDPRFKTFYLESRCRPQKMEAGKSLLNDAERDEGGEEK